MIGRAVGEDIVKEARDNGRLTQWIFTDITPDTFRWLSQSSTDGCATWTGAGEYQLRRRDAVNLSADSRPDRSSDFDFFTQPSAGEVLQEIDVSRDEGETWSSLFIGLYTLSDAATTEWAGGSRAGVCRSSRCFPYSSTIARIACSSGSLLTICHRTARSALCSRCRSSSSSLTAV